MAVTASHLLETCVDIMRARHIPYTDRLSEVWDLAQRPEHADVVTPLRKLAHDQVLSYEEAKTMIDKQELKIPTYDIIILLRRFPALSQVAVLDLIDCVPGVSVACSTAVAYSVVAGIFHMVARRMPSTTRKRTNYCKYDFTLAEYVLRQLLLWTPLHCDDRQQLAAACDTLMNHLAKHEATLADTMETLRIIQHSKVREKKKKKNDDVDNDNDDNMDNDNDKKYVKDTVEDDPEMHRVRRRRQQNTYQIPQLSQLPQLARR
jgi:hypothetical protein